MIDKSAITTILFDLGGVLIRLHGTPFKPAWITEGQTDDDVWPLWKRSTAVRLFESGQIESENFVQRFIAEAGLQVGHEEFVKHFMKWPAQLFPGVEQMLQELGRSYRLAALSNSNALHWPMIMRDMRLQEYIPDCISSHQIRVMKPDRQAFEAVLTRLDLQPREILFLDDLQVSIDMARELGMKAVKVTGTIGGVETVRSLGLII